MSSHFFHIIQPFDILTQSTWYGTQNYLVLGKENEQILLIQITSLVEPNEPLDKFTVTPQSTTTGIAGFIDDLDNNFFFVDKADVNEYKLLKQGNQIVRLNQVSLIIDNEFYDAEGSTWANDVAAALVNVRNSTVECTNCYSKELVTVLQDNGNTVTLQRQNGSVQYNVKKIQNGRNMFEAYKPSVYERTMWGRLTGYDARMAYYWSKGEPVFTLRKFGGPKKAPRAFVVEESPIQATVPQLVSPTPSAPPMDCCRELTECERQNRELRQIVEAMQGQRDAQRAAERAAHEENLRRRLAEEDRQVAERLAREEKRKAKQSRRDAETARQVQARAAAPAPVSIANQAPRRPQRSLRGKNKDVQVSILEQRMGR